MPSNERMASTQALRPFKVLVLGGSYGGLSAALNLQDLCGGRPPRCASEPPDTSKFGKIPVDITVVEEKDGYYHLISSPLALASKEYAAKAWTKFTDIPGLKNLQIIQGSVQNVNSSKKHATIIESLTNSSLTLDYDFLVAATGLRRVWPVVPQAKSRESYLSEASEHIDAVSKAADGVVVIGGGAVGIEMAGELKLVMPEQRVTLIHSRDKLCSSEPLPDDFKDRCLTALQESGVETILSQRVLKTEASQAENGSDGWNLHLSDGSKIRAGYVIHAVSKSVPTTTYLDGSALDKDGYVKVTPRLNFPPESANSQYHFAVGDLTKWTGIKRCGAAMHMGQYAAQNIHQLMLEQVQGVKPKFMELDPITPMMAIAIGKQAVAHFPPDGTTFGEELMEVCFGNDLAFSMCWNHLKLSEEPAPSL